jgi:hypothetical protein
MKRWWIAMLLAACSGSSTPKPTSTHQPPDNTAALDAAPATAAADCTTDGDCEIYCPSADGCCTSDACGCENAIPHTDHAKLDADYAQSCERMPDCPVYDCAYVGPVFARCDSGRCVPTTGPTGP